MTDSLTYAHITADNIADYPVGTKLVVTCGAYYPEHETEVVNWRFEPPNRFNSQHKAYLVYRDEYGTEQTTDRLAAKGIGVYLLDYYMNPKGL